MNWADVSDDTSLDDIKKPVVTETVQQSENDILLAEEQLKTINLTNDEPEDNDDNSKSLQLGKVEVTNPSGDKSIYEVSTSFEDLNLNPKLLEGVYAMGFTKPSLIQSAALPKILKGNDIIAQAHHGSGKTATFSLSMLSIVDPSLRAPQAICLCNTRELAQQIIDVVTKLGKFIGISCFLAVKGVRASKITNHIIVGTPGAVANMTGSFVGSNIKMLVFDEADVLIGDSEVAPSSGRGGRGRGGAGAGSTRNGLVQQSATIEKACTKAQKLLFSATFSDNVLTFAKKMCPQADMITLKKEKLALDNITQYSMHCNDSADKYEQLCYMYENIDSKQSIIFCNTVADTKELCNSLRKDNFEVSVIYGQMENDDRLTAIQDFRDGKTKILISTNLISRGIDVPAVSLVINYDIPMKTTTNRSLVVDPDTYMHRIGRSGRFGRNACAISMTHDEVSRNALKAIENEYEHPTTEVFREDIHNLYEAVQAAYEGRKWVKKN